VTNLEVGVEVSIPVKVLTEGTLAIPAGIFFTTLCIKDKLVEALSKIERIANRNSHLPILSCVLLIARDTTLTLKVTNLEVGVEVSIPVKVLTEGTLAIPAGILFTTLHNIKSQKIIIEEKGELVNSC
jgi:DNA polymerase-3 subunit beta